MNKEKPPEIASKIARRYARILRMYQDLDNGDIFEIYLSALTHVYDPLERDFILLKQEQVEWKGDDGTTIEGILIYPLNYQPGTRYPLILQVWHLAREYAIHADDIEVPMSAGDRREQLRWRAAFGLFAAREEGEAIEATLEDERATLRHDGRDDELDLETFVAYLTDRPQQLKDPKARALVRRLR